MCLGQVVTIVPHDASKHQCQVITRPDQQRALNARDIAFMAQPWPVVNFLLQWHGQGRTPPFDVLAKANGYLTRLLAAVRVNAINKLLRDFSATPARLPGPIDGTHLDQWDAAARGRKDALGISPLGQPGAASDAAGGSGAGLIARQIRCTCGEEVDPLGITRPAHLCIASTPAVMTVAAFIGAS